MAKIIKKQDFKPKFVVVEASGFHMSKLIKDDVKEKLKRAFGKETLFSIVGLTTGDKITIILYPDKKKYKEGKCVLISGKKETIKKYVDVLGKI